MFELAVIVIAIALLPFALAVAVPLTIFAVIVVTVLALAYQIMQGDPTLGIVMAVGCVVSLILAWIMRGRFGQAAGPVAEQKAVVP
jgi:hypothetical protein